MKRLFYFVLLLVGVSAVHSCKNLADEDGNPLLDINNTTGLTGPRALYREITNSDTLATYYYNGLQLSRVATDSASFANVSWSGNKASMIDFKGFLDLDNNGKMDKDSIIYTQLFTYGNTGRLESISENRSFFHRIVAPPYSATNPSPQTLYKKTKTIYTLKYSASTGKLDSLNMKSGLDISGTTFTNNAYSKTKYEYLGDNVARVIKHYGPITANTVGAPTIKLSFEYSNYDVQISPFTLLPNAYKISRLVSSDIYLATLTTPFVAKQNDANGWLLSPNSPKRILATDLTQPVPSPVVFSTDYRYDPQTYMTVGYGVNYIYKPF